MSATASFDGSSMDRRALLRFGLLGGAMLAVTAANATGVVSVVEHLSADLGRSSSDATSGTSLPSAATWGALVGQLVDLTGAGFERSSARVLDVADVAHPSPHVRLRGEAYSVLFDAPFLPGEPSAVVTVHHRALDAPTLVLLPVNGDGSWEAVVDRRTHIPTL